MKIPTAFLPRQSGPGPSVTDMLTTMALTPRQEMPYPAHLSGDEFRSVHKELLEVARQAKRDFPRGAHYQETREMAAQDLVKSLSDLSSNSLQEAHGCKNAGVVLKGWAATSLFASLVPLSEFACYHASAMSAVAGVALLGAGAVVLVSGAKQATASRDLQKQGEKARQLADYSQEWLSLCPAATSS